MANKKSIMTVSALLILMYHLWIVQPQDGALYFFKKSAYIGVDIFFLLSAFSLAGRPKIATVKEYGAFVWNRFLSVYLKYILFVVVALLYTRGSVVVAIKRIAGVELFEKFGGAFLWFVPAIMMFYLVYPLFRLCEEKNRMSTLLGITILWLAVSLFADNSYIFIVWNRIPIFLIGYYMYRWKDRLDRKRTRIVAGVVLMLVGYGLLYQFTFATKVSVPFTDVIYLIAIPVVIGLTMLVSLVPENKVILWIGSATLEIYAIQMIFGYRFTNWVYGITKSAAITNLIAMVAVVVAGVICSVIYSWIRKKSKLVRAS